MAYNGDVRCIFKTREAAVMAACKASPAPPYSDMRTRSVIVKDPIHYAGGRVFTWKSARLCKDGQTRDFYGWEVGA